MLVFVFFTIPWKLSCSWYLYDIAYNDIIYPDSHARYQYIVLQFLYLGREIRCILLLSLIQFIDNSIFCTIVCITVILWVPGARLKHSVPLVQYTEDCDGCQVVVAQWWEHWWLKSVALDSIPSDYQPAYFHFPLSALFSMWGEISNAVILYIYVTYLMVISYIQ